MADFDVNAVPLLNPSSATASTEQQPLDANAATLGAPEFTGGVTYRMRANDGTLGYPVYWESVAIDALGNDYSGPGPLTDVVVSEVIGLP